MNTNSAVHADPGAVQAQARRLFDAKDFVQSEQLFASLTEIPSHAGEGYYGLGMIRIAQGDWRASAGCFSRVAPHEPRYASALYQQGVIAERERRIDDASRWFQQALDADPTLRAARAKLNQLRPIQPGLSTGPAQVVNPRRQTAGDQYGLYGLLLADGSPLSKRTLEIIDRLRMTTRPRFISHEWRVVTAAALTILLVMVLRLAPPNLTQLQLGGMTFDPVFAAAFASAITRWSHLMAVVLALGIIYQYLAVKMTLYKLDMGRLELHSGVLLRRRRNLELWRVSEVGVWQGPLNQLTGDAQVELIVEHGLRDQIPHRFLKFWRRHDNVFKVAGLVQTDQLDELYFELRNLVFLLRSNPAVKGIIS